MHYLTNIFRLGIKELYSLKRDLVLMLLIAWSFTLGVYVAAEGLNVELHNASIAIVDEDHSQLSNRLREAFLPPHFNKPQLISFAEIDPAMDVGRYTFVLVVPDRFESDVRAGNQPAIQVNIDATAVMQAGIGANYISNIISEELERFAAEMGESSSLPITLVTRYAFNPNLTTSWFTSVMEIITFITVLTVVLTGAAIIREREHGTLEHLLVMPLTPFEIMLGKVWPNGLVLLVATALSLWIVVDTILEVPIAGSVPLFLAGAVAYLFFASAFGILLGTVARSMPQFGLLFILTVLPMILLSGGFMPLESQPEWLQSFTRLMPSTQFTMLAQGILYRGAGFGIVWPHFALMTGVGLVFFILAAVRFRRSISMSK